ncbi:MAG: YidC/Oxa1 family membrane protein insertase [Patescibacteria group bacterium]|nr:MAG: YidC/Oxa1 family membrane protein insertase [Patescibacteria group bacterium]WKZ24817.1 MAG: YidC/Oxa1 family membrane protein insertase [Patescibacteria group bacterium]
MGGFFNTFFYEPILNLLVFIYNTLPGSDIGWSIVILTIVIKLILYPLSKKSIESQKALQDLQPKIEEIKRKYKDDKEAMSKAMMDLYKTEKVNPLSSCLPLLIQLPFFWAIFRVFNDELSGKTLDMIYPFIVNPGTMNPIAFGFVDFSETNIVLAILAGASQYFQIKMMPNKPAAIKSEGAKDENMMAMMNKQMLYIMPVLTVVICMTLPSGLAFYWFVSTILTLAQQWYIFRNNPKNKENSGQGQVIEGEIIK